MWLLWPQAWPRLGCCVMRVLSVLSRFFSGTGYLKLYRLGVFCGQQRAWRLGCSWCSWRSWPDGDKNCKNFLSVRLFLHLPLVLSPASHILLSPPSKRGILISILQVKAKIRKVK